MRVRSACVALMVLLVAGCGSVAAPAPVSIAPVEVMPANVEEVTPEATTDTDACNREASLRPGPLPPPGNMPPGSTMARIAERGRLIAGVDQNQYLFGYRNPFTGELEGFDVSVAREISRAIFGDPNRIQFRVVSGAEREAVLQSGEVDIVVRTYSITCERKEKVAFSTVYFYADQKVLVLKDSGINTTADVAGKRACSVKGTTSAAKMYGLNPAKLYGAGTWTDCLVMLQQGQVDAIGTDGVVLAGLNAQDPNTVIIGPNISVEPYGVGIKTENEDLVRFVNGVLQRIRDDGTWEQLYSPLTRAFGASPGPPTPRYRD